jgi:hypothetical protein
MTGLMLKGEPPSTGEQKNLLFLVGRNSCGNWVARDQKGLCGGLFIGRAEAVKFAMFENGHHPEAVVMVPGVLELDISNRSSDRIDSGCKPQGRCAGGLGIWHQHLRIRDERTVIPSCSGPVSQLQANASSSR